MSNQVPILTFPAYSFDQRDRPHYDIRVNGIKIGCIHAWYKGDRDSFVGWVYTITKWVPRRTCLTKFPTEEEAANHAAQYLAKHYWGVR